MGGIARRVRIGDQQDVDLYEAQARGEGIDSEIWRTRVRSGEALGVVVGGEREDQIAGPQPPDGEQGGEDGRVKSQGLSRQMAKGGRLRTGKSNGGRQVRRRLREEAAAAAARRQAETAQRGGTRDFLGYGDERGIREGEGTGAAGAPAAEDDGEGQVPSQPSPCHVFGRMYFSKRGDSETPSPESGDDETRNATMA